MALEQVRRGTREHESKGNKQNTGNTGKQEVEGHKTYEDINHNPKP